MKVNELMIGDWVKFDEDICSVDEVRLDGTVVLTSMNTDLTSIDGSQVEDEEIEPIPLTPEILEKNGFKFEQQGSLEVAILKMKNRHPITLEYIGWSDGRWSIQQHRLVVKYVHELQHALRLCGIDKEIKI